MTTTLDRRRFLRLLGLGTGAAALGGGALAACTSDGKDNADGTGDGASATVPKLGASSVKAGEAAARTLVVIEMGGGNDGLATLAPVGQGRYQQLRPNLAFKAEDVVDLGDGWGLHKGLEPVAARLAIVEGIGAPANDLSHFAMQRRWWQGDPEGEERFRTGFLGRCCDLLAGDEPITGASLGQGSAPSLAADKASTLALPDIESMRNLFGDEPPARGVRAGWTALASGGATGELGQFTIDGIGGALELLELLRDIPETDAEYPGSALGGRLALTSRLIRSGAGVRVIHVPMGDFDTHDDQRGRHDGLMTEIGDALAVFLDDLEKAGRSGDVLVATVSEFGRRPESNANGTDHGGASVALLAGPVKPGRHGDSPSLDALDEQGNLVPTLNFRDYYATLAEGWLGIPASEVLAKGATKLDGLLS